jgi:hypothetical protein
MNSVYKRTEEDFPSLKSYKVSTFPINECCCRYMYGNLLKKLNKKIEVEIKKKDKIDGIFNFI